MWPRLLNILAGLWIMAAPAILGYNSEAAIHNARITGPLIITFAIIAIAEPTRPCRWMVFLAGLWLMASPFILGHWNQEILPASSDIASGAFAAVFSLFPGRPKNRFDGGWSMLWKGTSPNPPVHE